MKVIYKARATGKTTELIKLSFETGYYIVTGHHKPSRLAQRARELNLSIPFPLTVQEFLDGRYHAGGVKGVLIDDIDVLLMSISKVPVGAITLSPDVEGEKEMAAYERTGIGRAVKERREQLEVHGRTVELDVKLNGGFQLKYGAVTLIENVEPTYQQYEDIPHGWDPVIWKKMLDKPYTDRLIISAALLCAEFDRLNFKK